jgi:ASC-1-like (ASCH) protein
MPKTKTLWIKEEFLQLILERRKTVEVRVGYDNILRLQPGDILLLNEQHPFKIVDIRHYPDFAAMTAVEESQAIAPGISDPNTLLELCRAIYPHEKEALGVVALQIKPIKNET